MRNYFKALQLPTSAKQELLATSLSSTDNTDRQIRPRHRADAYSILLDEERRDVYANTVELYEAMQIASAHLNDTEGMDSHHWRERLAEFDTTDEDLIPLSPLDD